MRYLLLPVVLMSVSACRPIPAEATLPTSNKQIRVDRLFTHDGVTVYRFMDQGRVIYYAVPFKGPIELTEVHEECVHHDDQDDCADVFQSTMTRPYR